MNPLNSFVCWKIKSKDRLKAASRLPATSLPGRQARRDAKAHGNGNDPSNR
jgi:hypothetical protein